MKKLLFLVLALVLAFALVSCGSEEVEDKKTIELGKVEGYTYFNNYTGIGINLDSGWTFYTEEQIKQLNGLTADNDEDFKKALKGASAIVDMLAYDANSNNITVVFEKSDTATLKKLSLDEIMANSFTGFLEGIGSATVVEKTTELTKIGDIDAGCLKVTCNVPVDSSDTVTMFTTQLIFEYENYLVSIGINCYNEDNSASVIPNIFSK